MKWIGGWMAKYRKKPAYERLQIADRGITEEQKKAFGVRIRRIRKNRGLLQEDGMWELGGSQGALSHWENGERFPSSHELRRLSGYYGVPVIEMLGGSEEAQGKLNAVRQFNEDKPHEEIADNVCASFCKRCVLARIMEGE